MTARLQLTPKGPKSPETNIIYGIKPIPNTVRGTERECRLVLCLPRWLLPVPQSTSALLSFVFAETLILCSQTLTCLPRNV